MLSTNNPQYKQFVKLSTQSKVRRRTGQSVLHGIHLCQAYLDRAQIPLSLVYSAGAEANPEVQAILQRCRDLGVPELNMPGHTERAVSGVDSGVGLAFIVSVPQPESPQVLVSTALLLDTVQDPANVGALIRTAAAAGVQSVYLSEGCASAWSPRALRAGMGGQLAVDIYESRDLTALISQAQVPVYVTSLDASQSVYEANLAGPGAWLFGNEGTGVSSELLSLGAQAVIIPQSDSVESLNVAAAAAVCLFEQRRQQLP